MQLSDHSCALSKHLEKCSCLVKSPVIHTTLACISIHVLVGQPINTTPIDKL